jgi:hypothetical protein
MHFISVAVLWLCMILSADTYSATIELYVSPQGRGNTCSMPYPCSITTTQEKVRSLNQKMNGDIIIYVRGGVPLSNILNIPSAAISQT